jgi:acyl-CoA dehydrogenase
MHDSPPDAIARGRARLVDWRSQASTAWYRDNAALQACVRHFAPHLEDADHAALAHLGDAVGQAEPLVHRCSHDPYLPVLERFDHLGRRHERVRFDGAYHQWGEIVYGSGVMSKTGQLGQAVAQAAQVILLGHHGEAGHVCPLACTAGLILALQRVGHPALQQALLPGLTAPDYARRLHGAQFLTEVQGGSDVGAHATSARLLQAGSEALPPRWSIHGEKWFCSVIDAPLYLMTARPQGAPSGTRGLGMFVVPHDLAHGDAIDVQPLSHRLFDAPRPVNHMQIRRLKHKLGTRAMASGEVDWDGAVAWQLGDLERGFAHVVEIVLNTSRLFNAMACAGMMWRSWREAAGFAMAREAFGQPIAQFAAVDRAVAQLYAEAVAATASTLDLVALGETGRHPAALRLGLNMNKYWTSVRATQMLRLGMEVLGGNGAIEDFSPLGRLYRDAMVTESWEGTHNVLVAQTQRDLHKLRLHEDWLAWLAPRVAATAGPLRTPLDARLERLARLANELLGRSDEAVTLALRSWIEEAMVLHQATCLAELAHPPIAAFPADVAALLLDCHPLQAAGELRGWWPRPR